MELIVLKCRDAVAFCLARASEKIYEQEVKRMAHAKCQNRKKRKFKKLMCQSRIGFNKTCLHKPTNGPKW